MTYDLPLSEALQLTETGSCTVTYNIYETIYCDNLSLTSDKKTKFNIGGKTEIVFPVLTEEKTNVGRLWNNSGDGTHCSERLYTPFSWVVGDTITFKNKDMGTTSLVMVQDIKIILDPNMNIVYWSIAISK